MQRAVLVLLLASVAAAAGCLTPSAEEPGARVPEPSSEQPPAEEPAEEPARSAQAEGRAAPAPPQDERLWVGWSPAEPKPGDVLRVRVDAPLRWPEPRCDIRPSRSTPSWEATA